MLTRYDPFRPFEQFWRQPTGNGRVVGMPMDAYRHADAFLVEFDLPGVDRDSIDVSVEDSVLQVTARRSANYSADDHILITERRHGQVTRQLVLDRGVDADGIEATYDAGVLSLRIPIAEEAKPRKIAIDTNGHKSVSASSA